MTQKIELVDKAIITLMINIFNMFKMEESLSRARRIIEDIFILTHVKFLEKKEYTQRKGTVDRTKADLTTQKKRLLFSVHRKQ